MNEPQKATCEPLPILLSAKDAEFIGLSKSAFYRLLNRENVPCIIIGGRKYLHRDRFFAWLNERVGGAFNDGTY